MDKTFTYVGDLSTGLDWARWRLRDFNENITVDETGSPSPWLWDATYLALFERYGIQEGAALAAEQVAGGVSELISSFGEQGGVRFSLRNYYNHVKDLAKKIRGEAPWDEGEFSASIRIGAIRTGVDDTYALRKFEAYPAAAPPGWKWVYATSGEVSLQLIEP